MSVDLQEFWAASDARRVAAAHYLYNPRVTLIDIGWKIKGGQQTDQMAVRIHVRDKPSEAVFESFSAQNAALVIDKGKVPFDVVDLIEANYRLHQYYGWHTPYVRVNEHAGRRDPLCGGISISNERFHNYGTLGGIVTDKTTGEAMILSNWHVLAGSFYASKGQKIYQPGIGDGGSYRDAIATLERDAMLDGFDAAVAKLNAERDWANNQLEWEPVKGSEAPRLGMRVVKSGRGSNVTYGVIDGVEGEYPIWYGGLRRKIKTVQRIVPQPGQMEVSRGGDSGSWWLHQATNRAVGLHFAGMDDPETSLAMAMPQVLNALGVEIMI
jgi:endonuclease G